MTRNAKILVVDDSQAILTYVQGILSSAGYDVVTSNNPILVASHVRREKPDMILMDIEMPAISGEDVVATLQRFGCSDGVRVVLFSASVSAAELAQKAEAVGAHGYIHKASPLRPETLLAAVDRLLAQPLKSGPDKRPEALVVDDSSAMRMLLTQVLQEQGYKVRAAAHGKDALHLLREKTPNCAFVDLEMPEMDGLELVVAMRENPDTFEVPIVLVTSVSDQARIDAVLSAGASSYLPKPVDKASIVNGLRSLNRPRPLGA